MGGMNTNSTREKERERERLHLYHEQGLQSVARSADVKIHVRYRTSTTATEHTVEGERHTRLTTHY